MKKVKKQPETTVISTQPETTTINNKPDNVFLILAIAFVLFIISTLLYISYATMYHTNETQIIKVKYTSVSGIGVVDECGHPMRYSSKLANNQINLSDVYEIDIQHNLLGDEIIHFQLINEDEYIKNC